MPRLFVCLLLAFSLTRAPHTSADPGDEEIFIEVESALFSDPQNPRLRLEHASLLLAHGRLAEAQDELRRALLADPCLLPAIRLSITAAAEAGQERASRAFLQQAYALPELGPLQRADFLGLEAALERRAGHLHRSIRLLEQALALAAEEQVAPRADWVLNLADDLRLLGRADQGIALLADQWKRHRHGSIRRVLVDELIETDHAKRALVMVNEAIESERLPYRWLNRRAEILARADPVQAQADLAQSAALMRPRLDSNRNDPELFAEWIGYLALSGSLQKGREQISEIDFSALSKADQRRIKRLLDLTPSPAEDQIP